MPLPTTFGELMHGGYGYSGQGRCRDCNQRVEFWMSPGMEPVVLNLILDLAAPVVRHIATCSYTEKYKKPQV